MRLHPAVATALALVGGLLIYMPLNAWHQLVLQNRSVSDIKGELFLVWVVCEAAGAGIIFAACVTSMSAEPRPGPPTP